ncbi:MAG: cell division protein ZapE [Hyphomicrobiales bacterium]|nr:cell division protein ZapE [Hyphomicrobiales bacterium]
MTTDDHASSSPDAAVSNPAANPNHASKQRRLSGEIAAAIEQGQLKPDTAQAKAIEALDDILDELHSPKLGNKKSALGWLFGKKPRVADDSVRGLYLWGGVGRGKTMLMDRFFDLAPAGKGAPPKRRVHFHAFMLDVHARIHAWRQQQKTAKERSADPIPPLAAELAKESQLLCFDEFAVTDVADAMLLGRLFTGLFGHGVTVVATSNVQPDGLYKDGLNRSFFLPFIALVKERMVVMELASATDYRMELLGNHRTYMVGDDADAQLDGLWREMTDGLIVEPASIEVAGRQLDFAQTCGGLVRESFDALCKRPLGAGDYLALTERFHTLFLEHVPVMEFADKNAAKRFIALIDTLYDQGRILIVSAEERPSKLYNVDHGTEAFEFERTISRLREMQSEEWLDRQNLA